MLVWGGPGRDVIEILGRWDIDVGGSCSGGGGGCGGRGGVGEVYSVQYGDEYSARRGSGGVSVIEVEAEVVCSPQYHP